MEISAVCEPPTGGGVVGVALATGALATGVTGAALGMLDGDAESDGAALAVPAAAALGMLGATPLLEAVGAALAAALVVGAALGDTDAVGASPDRDGTRPFTSPGR